MATVQFNSTDIPFGKVMSQAHNFELKEWAFPGVDGLEFMSMGFRGRLFRVEGRSVPDIDPIAKSALEAFVDGTAHTLRSGDGETYDDCVCMGVSYLSHYTDQNGLCFEFALLIRQMEA